MGWVTEQTTKVVPHTLLHLSCDYCDYVEENLSKDAIPSEWAAITYSQSYNYTISSVMCPKCVNDKGIVKG